MEVIHPIGTVVETAQVGETPASPDLPQIAENGGMPTMSATVPLTSPRSSRPWQVVALAGLATVSILTFTSRAQPDLAQPDLRPLVQPTQPTADADAKDEDWRLSVLAPSIKARLAGSLISDEEKKDLRIRHGVWLATDLDSPSRRALAALSIASFQDSVFDQADLDPLLRAQGLLGRGDAAKAIEVISAAPEATRLTMVGRLITARAQVLTGALDAAKTTLQPLVERITTTKIDDPAELIAAVRGVALYTRHFGPVEVRGQKAEVGGDHRAMMGVLARVREELDRTSWEATLAEAEILYEKDNMGEANAAVQKTLTLNPSCARAWFIAGQIAVDQFDINKAEQIAGRLDELTLGEHAGELGTSPYGAMVLGRARMRQGEGADAVTALERALKIAPNHNEVLAMRAAAIATTFDFTRADDLLKQADATIPNWADGHYQVGKALSDARQYGQAAIHLREAAKRAPFWPDPLIELGLLSLQSGQDAEALESLEKAATLDRFNVRAGNSLSLARDLRTYDTLESEHFIVRYRKEFDGVLAAEMLAPLEENYKRVTGNGPGGIDWPLKHKTVITLLPDHRVFAVRITGMAQIHTIAASTGPVIAMESPKEGPDHLGTYDWVRVLRHEFVHTVTLDRTANRLPHWFTEASAVYLEDAPRAWQTVQLLARAFRDDALFDLDEINLAFIRPKKPTDRALGYAQGHWMYEYIMSFGARKPLELMDLYATGVREEEAMQKVLGVSRQDFVIGFKAWAGEQLRSWGMAAPQGMPTAAEILKTATGSDDEPSPEVVDEALRQYPDHPELLSIKVQRMAAESRDEPTAEMVPWLIRYAKARPVAELPHKLLARYYLDPRSASPHVSRQNAIEHLEWLDVREEKLPSFAMELARRYAAAGEWEKCWGKARRAMQLAPYDPRTRELAASIAVTRGDLNEAERLIRSLIAIEPNVEQHKKRLEKVLEMKGK